MKRIILLLLGLLLLENVKAYDLAESFYYDEEKVENVWITRVKDDNIMSGNPYLLKRKSDNAFVYCMQPFAVLKKEDNYKGYYSINELFDFNEEQVNKIRLLAHFGYKYPGHEDIKWYGITQYLIWKVIEPNADIYFADSRYGNRIIIYEEEINEIERLIDNYLEILKIKDTKIIFNSIDEFVKWKGTNIFFKDIEISSNQTVKIPNSNSNNEEIFFYHEKGQNVYLYGNTLLPSISFEIEFIKELIIRKWYGSGKYHLEEGATFEIYQNNKLIDTITTDKYGIAHTKLSHGNYKIVQIKGIDGYNYIEPFEINIGTNKLNELIELYDEAIVVEVPDTSKHSRYILFLLIPLLFIIRRKIC